VGARRPLIAVFGSSTIAEGDERYRAAEQLGRLLAAGGHVVGVTVELFERRGPVNPWVEERVHTRDLFERLRTIIERADGFIAVAGSVGTLAEVFLTWNLLMAGARPAAPLVLMGRHWRAWLEAQRAPDLVLPELFEYVRVVDTPAEAVRAVFDGRSAPAA
jgi:predicted Rossmann-fold nucleotide-binding protein